MDVYILSQYHSALSLSLSLSLSSPNSKTLTSKFHFVSTMSSASNCTTRITSQPLSFLSCDGTTVLRPEPTIVLHISVPQACILVQFMVSAVLWSANMLLSSFGHLTHSGILTAMKGGGKASKSVFFSMFLS